MSVSTEVRTIRQEQERRFEENQRFEEMTDLAERIGFPIETTISYELRGESLYATTDTRSRAFIEQTYQAKQEAVYAFTGDQAFEAVRRSHENDEALMAEQLARGELAGNVLVKVSKIPDAVVEGRTSIKGYKRDTLRTFVRVYHRDGPMVRCGLFSIDHNDQEGLRRVGQLVGMQLVDRSSEDILADSVLFDVDEPDVFADRLREQMIRVYDDAILEQTGEQRRAGSKFVSELDAQSAVGSQTGLLSQHFAAISAIVGLRLNAAATEDLLELERTRTAAAISLASRGYVVTSTSDQSVSAEVESGDYGRECASATENGMRQGQSDLFEDWDKVAESCPICHKVKVLASKRGDIITGSCGCWLNVCTGDYERGGQQSTKTTDTRETESLERSAHRKMTKEELVRRAYGEKAVLSIRSVIGGMRYDIRDAAGKLINTVNDVASLRDLL